MDKVTFVMWIGLGALIGGFLGYHMGEGWGLTILMTAVGAIFGIIGIRYTNQYLKHHFFVKIKRRNAFFLIIKLTNYINMPKKREKSVQSVSQRIQ